VGYIEGPYLISYFILADEDGEPTVAEGAATVRIESIIIPKNWTTCGVKLVVS